MAHIFEELPAKARKRRRREQGHHASSGGALSAAGGAVGTTGPPHLAGGLPTAGAGSTRGLLQPAATALSTIVHAPGTGVGIAHLDTAILGGSQRIGAR